MLKYVLQDHDLGNCNPPLAFCSPECRDAWEEEAMTGTIYDPAVEETSSGFVCDRCWVVVA